VSLACGPEDDPGAQLCARLLEQRIPAAEVLEVTVLRPQRESRIRYEWPGADGSPVRDEIGCETEESAPGRLRARSVTLEGQQLSEAEIVLINSDLLLEDIRSAAPPVARH
jgi:hypothetical protein